jgi:hypothetical protein
MLPTRAIREHVVEFYSPGVYINVSTNSMKITPVQIMRTDMLHAFSQHSSALRRVDASIRDALHRIELIGRKVTCTFSS